MEELHTAFFLFLINLSHWPESSPLGKAVLKAGDCPVSLHEQPRPVIHTSSSGIRDVVFLSVLSASQVLCGPLQPHTGALET